MRYATAWRVRCRAHAAVRARPAPLVGTRIRLAKPLTFADEICHGEFIVVQYVRRGRKRTAYRAPNGRLYRIPNIQTRDYEVIDGPVSGSVAG
ncbi:DUF6927 domain-containing protein [Asticcacaulis sp. W401b]|uniref:DUF6927 domain-containing protein n=1 Tax=Asticcacaulis sp. W401b TaxID=3388666 RepID=UPI0039705B50